MLYPKTNPNIEKLWEKVESGEISRAEFIIQKKPFTFFGYDTKRKFWYAIGKPIAILYFSLMLLYASTHIVLDDLKKIFRITTSIGIFISFYFIVWALWYKGDFPITAYYISIGIIAILSAYTSYLLIVFRNGLLAKIKILTSFIIGKGRSYVPKENEKAYIRDYLETFRKLVR